MGNNRLLGATPAADTYLTQSGALDFKDISVKSAKGSWPQHLDFLIISQATGETSLVNINNTKLNYVTSPGNGLLGATAAREYEMSPDGVYVAGVTSTTPYIHIYKRDRYTYTKLPNPAALPTGTGNSVSWSLDSNYLAVAHATSPYLTIYKRTGDTFTKLANPTGLPTGTASSCAFTRNSLANYLAVGHGTTPFITIYKQTGDTFTKLNNPVPAQTVAGTAVAFSQKGLYLTAGFGTTPYIRSWQINPTTDTFNLTATPVSLPAGGVNKCSYSPENILALAHSTAPGITFYRINGTTFLKQTTTGTLPTLTANTVSWRDGWTCVIGTNASGVNGVQTYQYNQATGTMDRVSMGSYASGSTITTALLCRRLKTF
jgi:WD40 repeat protein